MKINRVLGISLTLLACSVGTSNAWLTAGRVLCDANQNGQIDVNDVAVVGVFVVVTNVSGTFSNGNFTATPNGDFALELPPVPDSYVEFVHPLSLPAGSTVVLPSGGAISFSLTATVSNFVGGDFLIANPACVQTNQPPPPPQTNNTCCLTGKGTIGGTSKKPLFTVSATVFPGCRCDKEDSGEFVVVANGLRLQFKGTVAEILDCGESVDSSSGVLINSIEVQGVGTLKGINGNRCNSGLVYFFAHVEDRSAAKLADALYFRAYASDNTTLLLISGDTANPTNVSPVSVCGNLVVGTDCCQENNQGGNGHGNGKGQGQGKGNQGDQDQGNKGKGGNGNDQGKGKGWGNNKGGSGKGKGGW